MELFSKLKLAVDADLSSLNLKQASDRSEFHFSGVVIQVCVLFAVNFIQTYYADQMQLLLPNLCLIIIYGQMCYMSSTPKIIPVIVERPSQTINNTDTFPDTQTINYSSTKLNTGVDACVQTESEIDKLSNSQTCVDASVQTVEKVAVSTPEQTSQFAPITIKSKVNDTQVSNYDSFVITPQV